MITEMVQVDKEEAAKEALLNSKGFNIRSPIESPPSK